jgi:hypothetical protein
MRLGELEGIVGEEDGYTAESDAAILLQGLDIADALHERRCRSCRAARRCACCCAGALRHPAGAAARRADQPPRPRLDPLAREFLNRYDGTLIVISHDRHFLNAVCTHTADIDYQTIITYTGGYDDMVLAKTQIRSRIESENAQREKKIAQLQRLHRALLGRHAPSQVQSRRKEVERLQTTSWRGRTSSARTSASR